MFPKVIAHRGEQTR